MLTDLIDIIRIAIQLYIYLLIASAIMSWLVSFGIVNTRNRAVHMIADFLQRITDPPLRPIRRFMPNLGGIDISPVLLILLLMLADRWLLRLAYA